jgi:monoamine oxidase
VISAGAASTSAQLNPAADMTDRNANRVVITGNGIAGAAAACDLRGCGFDVRAAQAGPVT